MIANALIAWFTTNGRDLPWRHTRDPYRVLVAELMLQQTQVERVIPKYHAFLAQFPDVQALAAAPTSAVITAWQGLLCLRTRRGLPRHQHPPRGTAALERPARPYP